MQDMVHSTREQYIDENGGSVTCFVSTESGVDAFATSTTNPDGSTAERLLTPLEAMRTFRAQIDTPTAELRPDHFDRQAALVHGPLTIEAIAAGNLKGIRKWVWERLAGTLFAQKATDALNALHAQPLTEHATMRLSQARRNRYSVDDIADLLNQLHEETAWSSSHRRPTTSNSSARSEYVKHDRQPIEPCRGAPLPRTLLAPAELECADSRRSAIPPKMGRPTLPPISRPTRAFASGCATKPGSKIEAELDRLIAKTTTDRLVIFHNDDEQVWRWPARRTRTTRHQPG